MSMMEVLVAILSVSLSESGGLPYVVVYDAQVCASACSRSRDCKLSICGRVMLIAACASREASVTALGDPAAWAVSGSRSCCPQVLVPVHDAVIQHAVIAVCLLDAPPSVFVTGSQAVSASVVDRVVSTAGLASTGSAASSIASGVRSRATTSTARTTSSPVLRDGA